MNQNKEIALAFRTVKGLLATPADILPGKSLAKHEFICNALGQAGDMGVTVGAAIDVIQKRIAPHGTLNAWVVHNVLGGDWNKCGSHAMQEYRHRWVDELIREFSAKK